MRHPSVPESLEGWWMLHRMFRFDRAAWSTAPPHVRERAVREFIDSMRLCAQPDAGDAAIAQTIGHKADLMLTHYGRTFDLLGAAQLRIDACELMEFLRPAASYVSVLELGLYEATARVHQSLQARELKPHSTEWNAAFEELLAQEAAVPRNSARLWARIPQRRYVCFYPMDKKRDGADNWYVLPYEQRAKLMMEHGKIGRSFHGLVTQVISGSIGYDDYEWGVDLYADDPLVFKKLIYEMRFDEASARYARFGTFYSGLQFSVEELPIFLEATGVPALRVLAAVPTQPARS